jgi:hypothetical protein
LDRSRKGAYRRTCELDLDRIGQYRLGQQPVFDLGDRKLNFSAAPLRRCQPKADPISRSLYLRSAHRSAESGFSPQVCASLLKSK